MTTGKAAVLAAGFVGALAIGVAIGAAMDDKWRTESWFPRADDAAAPAPESAMTPEAAEKSAPAVRTKSAAPKPAATPRARRAAPPPAGSVTTVAVDMWEPELRKRAKAVLNPGTRIDLAAADFETAEQFMTVAHAARNTNVPFMVLKHRVLNEQRPLADAIHESKPELDARAEAQRAREAARADVA
jgi:hypothetical protein